MTEKKCMICGSQDKLTSHHLRDIHSKFAKRCVGKIILCRNCHDVVEDIVNKGKSKKLWYDKGYIQGIEDYKAQISWSEEREDKQ